MNEIIAVLVVVLALFFVGVPLAMVLVSLGWRWLDFVNSKLHIVKGPWD